MPLFVGHVGVVLLVRLFRLPCLGHVDRNGICGLRFEVFKFCVDQWIGDAEVPGLSQLVCPEVFISLQKIEREVSTLDLCSCSRQLEMHVKDGRVN